MSHSAYHTTGPQAPPRSVKTAVWLMYFGALLSLIGILVGVATKNDLLDATRRKLVEEGNIPAEVDSAMNAASNFFTWSVIVGGIIATLLWLLMAWANSKGRTWARIVATILFVLSTITVIGSIFGAQETGAANFWLSIVMWLIGLVAVVLLWRADSSEYYHRSAA